MNIISRSRGLVLLTVLLLSSSMPVLAQAQDIPNMNDIPMSYATASATTSYPVAVNPEVQRPTGAVDCFQYYTFGSVQVDVEPSLPSTVPGTPLTFSGDITNSNPYPIVDGTVMVKVFKVDGQNEDKVHANGYPVVDQYYALQHVSLPANGKKTVSFDWNVPGYTLTGDYELHTFFMTSQRFNLQGLPFTDDITGNKIPFSVIGQAIGQVAFDKNSVTINNQPYNFAVFPPLFPKTESVTVTASVVNTTKVQQTAVINWSLFNWAGERTSNRLDGKTETVVLKPGETKKVSYVAAKSAGTVSFVQAKVKYKDAQSILNIRFTRDGYEETRLNFPSTLTYPLVAGQEAGIFSCLHSTGAPVVEGGKVTLSVKDLAGKVLHTYTYDGVVTGDMMGVKDSFVPATSLSNFDVVATLWNKGQQVEEVTVPYRCADIDPTLCDSGEASTVGSTTESGSSAAGVISYRMLWVIVAVGVLLCGVLIFVVRRRRTQLDEFSEEDMTPPTGLLMLLCLVVAGALFLPTVTLAKSTVYNINDIPNLYFYFHWDDGLFDNRDHYWNLGLDPGSAQITYKAQLVNLDGGAIIGDRAGVPVGTKFKVEHLPYSNTDIQWVRTGYGFDSPYGYWVKDAKRGGAGIPWNAGFVGIFTDSNGCRSAEKYTYTPFLVNPPVPEVVNPTSNLSCTGNVCTVMDPGPFSVSMKFPETFGQFFYRFYVTELRWRGICSANMTLGDHFSTIPMSANGSNNSNTTSNAPYQLVVPEQSITFNARGFTASARPSDVIVTPLPNNSNLTEEAQGFDLYATDPDNDQIRYVIDWDNNGSPDQLVPGSGYVDSGTKRRVFHTWIAPGTYTFTVWAQDSTGVYSDPVDTDITITQPDPTATLDVVDCDVAVGESTCATTVSWAFDHADAPYVIRNNTTNTIVSSDVSGATASTLAYGNNTLVARSSGVVLATTESQALCISGAVWDSSVNTCINSYVPEITLVATHDVVRMKATTTLEWTISDLTANICTIKGPGLHNPYTISTKNGSLDIGQITSVSKFTLMCVSDLHDDIMTTETVEVIPNVLEI